MSGLATQPKVEPRLVPGDISKQLSSEPAILALMIVALGIFYLGPGLASIFIGIIAFFALTIYRPDLSLVMVPLAAPLFYRPRVITDNLHFSLAEVVIVCGFGAWVLRDGWSFLWTRKLPDVITVLKQPGVILAASFALIGLLWLLVPDSAHRKFALREFRWTVAEPVLFFAMMLRWLRTERDVWRMAGAWLVAAALVGREGIEQFLYGQTWSMEGVGRVTSVYPSATAFGIYMGRALALSLTLAFFLPSPTVPSPKSQVSSWRLGGWTWDLGLGTWDFRWKIASALLSIVIGLGVLFSFARGAWIGVFVAMLVIAIITRNRWLVGGIVLAVIGGLAALPFIKAERITSMFNFDTPDNTGVSRLRIWTSALRILRDHPLTGIGQDQFLYADPKYGVPNVRFLTLSHPHNWILDFWLRLGLPGLAWIAAALGFFFWQGLQLWKSLRGTALGALVLGLIASMIDFAVHGLLDQAYFNMDLALTFWLTMGLLMLVKRSTQQAEEATVAS